VTAERRDVIAERRGMIAGLRCAITERVDVTAARLRSNR
jgi:hypothetical protein